MRVSWSRRVIPRWRDSSISGATHSLLNSKGGASESPVLPDSKILVESLNEWRDDKSIGGAADLLNFAHVASALPLLTEPAEYLVSLGEPIPPALRQICLSILKDGVFGSDLGVVASDNLRPKEWYYYRASELKRRLIVNPRNAIALVDLARIYTVLGQKEKAGNAIFVATNLFPNHPFVLRSAARFYIQVDKADEGLYLLNKSARTSYDPWLLATRLSIEDILGKNHKQLRTARLLVDSEKFSPFQLGELSGSIASILIADGDVKQAKRMFNKSLIDPNDNVVAQALWAAQSYRVPIAIRDEWFRDPFSFEASYYQLCSDGDFEGAKNSAISWFLDEPITPRPLKAATFALLVLGDSKSSEKYALDGLMLDRDDIVLRNNLVCALAGQNKIEEAISQLQQVVHLEKMQLDGLSAHTIANCGMILYRQGQFEEGEKCYREAINAYSKENSKENMGIAFAFLAREAAIANAPNAKQIEAEAIGVMKEASSKAGQLILSSINKALDENKARLAGRPRLGFDWFFDIGKNIITIKKTLPFK